MLFVPEDVPEAELNRIAARGEFEPWLNAKGQRIGWKSIEGNPRNALLVCHGNGGFALETEYKDLRRDQAFKVYLLEFPGYAGRDGKPSAHALVTSAIEAIDLLHSDLECRIWAMGISMGSGVICAAVVSRPGIVSGLTLVTPFDSLSSAAGSRFPWIPVRFLLRHKLDSDKNLESYHGPVAFILAGNDRVIPPALGQRLYEKYTGPKRLWLLPGIGHNNRDDQLAIWPAVAGWLRENAREPRPGS
jgi:pimeloyl-ACP methyl ester carboxylesterase